MERITRSYEYERENCSKVVRKNIKDKNNNWGI